MSDVERERIPNGKAPSKDDVAEEEEENREELGEATPSENSSEVKGFRL